MKCLFCGGSLGLFSRGEFCSKKHRDLWNQQQAELSIARLKDAIGYDDAAVKLRGKRIAGPDEDLTPPPELFEHREPGPKQLPAALPEPEGIRQSAGVFYGGTTAPSEIPPQRDIQPPREIPPYPPQSDGPPDAPFFAISDLKKKLQLPVYYKRPSATDKTSSQAIDRAIQANSTRSGQNHFPLARIVSTSIDGCEPQDGVRPPIRSLELHGILSPEKALRPELRSDAPLQSIWLQSEIELCAPQAETPHIAWPAETQQIELRPSVESRLEKPGRVTEKDSKPFLTIARQLSQVPSLVMDSGEAPIHPLDPLPQCGFQALAHLNLVDEFPAARIESGKSQRSLLSPAVVSVRHLEFGLCDVVYAERLPFEPEPEQSQIGLSAAARQSIPTWPIHGRLGELELPSADLQYERVSPAGLEPMLPAQPAASFSALPGFALEIASGLPPQAPANRGFQEVAGDQVSSAPLTAVAAQKFSLTQKLALKLDQRPLLLLALPVSPAEAEAIVTKREGTLPPPAADAPVPQNPVLKLDERSLTPRTLHVSPPEPKPAAAQRDHVFLSSTAGAVLVRNKVLKLDERSLAPRTLHVSPPEPKPSAAQRDHVFLSSTAGAVLVRNPVLKLDERSLTPRELSVSAALLKALVAKPELHPPDVPAVNKPRLESIRSAIRVRKVQHHTPAFAKHADPEIRRSSPAASETHLDSRTPAAPAPSISFGRGFHYVDGACQALPVDPRRPALEQSVTSLALSSQRQKPRGGAVQVRVRQPGFEAAPAVTSAIQICAIARALPLSGICQAELTSAEPSFVPRPAIPVRPSASREPLAARRRPITPIRLPRGVFMRPIVPPLALESQSLSLAVRPSSALLPSAFKGLKSTRIMSTLERIAIQPQVDELRTAQWKATGINPYRQTPPLWTEAGGQTLATPQVQSITPPPVLRDCELASEQLPALGITPQRPLPALGYWTYQATQRKSRRPQFIKNLMSHVGASRNAILSLHTRTLGMVAASFETPALGVGVAPDPRQPEFVMTETQALIIDIEPRGATPGYPVEAEPFELMEDLISTGVEFAQSVFSTLSPTAIWASPEQKPSLQLSVREAEAAPQPSIGLTKQPTSKGELRWVARKVPWMPVG